MRHRRALLNPAELYSRHDAGALPPPLFDPDERYSSFDDGDAGGLLVADDEGLEQQFSGSGVPHRRQTEHRNRLARRTVRILAALVLALVVVPAILLIMPNAFRSGSGTAPHTAEATQISTAIPPVLDTPTLGPAGQPTPTSVPPTATPRLQPSPTPTRIPTPTPTVNPFGAAATVSFTRSQQPLSIPAAMMACAGCGINAQQGTIPGQYNNPTVRYDPAQWPLTYVSNYGATAPTTLVNVGCGGDFGVQCQLKPGYFVDDGGKHICYFNVSLTLISHQTIPNVPCIFYTQAYQCWNFPVFDLILDSNNFNPGLAVLGGDTNDCGGSNGGPANIIPYDCLLWHNTGKTTQSEALAYVKQQVEKQGAPTTIREGSPSLVGNYYCGDQWANWQNPGAAVSGSWWSQYQYATDWRYSYTQADAITLQQQRLQAAANQAQGFVLDTKTEQVCTTAQEQISNVVISGTSSHATISCAASGRALYDWSGKETQLAQALAGTTVAQATAILNQEFGIVSGSVSISVKGGASRLPQDPAQIQFVINDPGPTP